MNSKTILILLRHGETDINVEGRLDGQYDSMLTANGIDQAKKTAIFLQNKKIDIMYTSALRRSIDTGSYIAKYHAGLNIISNSKLNEIDCGLVTRQKKVDFLKEYPDIAARIDQNEDYQFPGGESVKIVEDRCIPYIKEIINSNLGKTIFISGHKTLNSVIMGYFLKIPYGLRFNIRQNNCCINQLSFIGNNIFLDFVNLTVNQ